MLPLIALPTHVKYQDLRGLKKLAWDAKMTDVNFRSKMRQLKSIEDQIKKLTSNKEFFSYMQRLQELEDEMQELQSSSKFSLDMNRMQTLEDEMNKLASELEKREPPSALQLVRDNDYELLTSWVVERVFLAVRPRGTPIGGPDKLIPFKFDPNTNLMGINLQNDPDFQRIDVGIHNGVYFDNTEEYVYSPDPQEYGENYFESDDLWNNSFDNKVRVVYRFTDGSLSTLYEQSWNKYDETYPIPIDTDYETFSAYLETLEDEDQREAFQVPKLVIYQHYQPEEVWVPMKDKARRPALYTRPGSTGKYNEWDWAPSVGTKRPLASPVFAMDSEKASRRVEEEGQQRDVDVTYWSNVGLFYYAINADVLMSIMEIFEGKDGVQWQLRKRQRE